MTREQHQKKAQREALEELGLPKTWLRVKEPRIEYYSGQFRIITKNTNLPEWTIECYEHCVLNGLKA